MRGCVKSARGEPGKRPSTWRFLPEFSKKKRKQAEQKERKEKLKEAWGRGAYGADLMQKLPKQGSHPQRKRIKSREKRRKPGNLRTKNNNGKAIRG